MPACSTPLASTSLTHTLIGVLLTARSSPACCARVPLPVLCCPAGPHLQGHQQ